MNLTKASKYLVFIIILYAVPLSAQSFSMGAELGGGIISSNSPQIGSFTSVIFFEGGLTDEDYTGYRISLFYAGDFSGLLPEDTGEYYPFIRGASVKFIHSAGLTNRFYFEQGLGVLVLNDRVFSDRNQWGYGLAVSLTAGKDLRSENYDGFKIGLGTEYGLTFLDFSASFFSIFLQGVYSF